LAGSVLRTVGGLIAFAGLAPLVLRKLLTVISGTI
jgi:hypothetical protein